MRQWLRYPCSYFPDRSERLPWCVAALLAVVAVASRVQIFGDPLADSDEGFYLLGGERLLHGATLYVDIWDRKPAGLFLLYAGMRLLGGGVVGYQIVGTVVALLTAWLVAQVASRFASPFAAAAAGMAYLLWLPLGSAAGGQAELFCNLPVTAAAMLTLQALERPDSAGRWFRGAIAMLLVGIALQIKYTALFAGIFLGCCWLYAGWRSGHRWQLVGLAALYVLAALTPTLLVAGWYAVHGHLDAFLYANFVSIWQRRAPPFAERLLGFATIALILAPLGVCIALYRHSMAGAKTAYRFSMGWLAAATAGLLAFGTYFQQFLLPVLMPASVAAASAFGAMTRRRTLILLGAVCILGQVDLGISHAVHGSRREAQVIVSAVDPQRCLFIYSGVAALYRLADACIPTRYAFPSHLSRLRESAAIGAEPVQEVERIMETRPGTVVFRDPYDGENWRARAVVLHHLRQSYHLVLRQQLGHRTICVYRLGEPRRDRGKSS